MQALASVDAEKSDSGVQLAEFNFKITDRIGIAAAKFCWAVQFSSRYCYMKEVGSLKQEMEEENLVTSESATSEKPVLKNSKHSLESGMAQNELFKKELAENELNPEEQPKGNPLATTACSQITPNSQHGDALDSGATNPHCEQFETTPTISKRPSIGNLVPSCLSIAPDPLPPPRMPGLIPLQHTQPSIQASSSRFSPPPSSSSSSPPSATQFALHPGLPDLVQVSSDSGSVDSHGNAGRCREYRKKRKRVLSECERNLAKMVAANSKLRRVAARLEHRVGKLKAFYIHSVLHSKYKCLNSDCMTLEK